MSRVIVFVLLAVMLFSSSIPPARPVAAQAAFPAPLPNMPKPTIRIGTTSGYMGQEVSVTGESSAPTSNIRIAWVYSGSTHTAAVVAREANGAFSATVSVPIDAETGKAQVCAVPAGASDVSFGCASFTITEPASGGISGQLPLDETAFARNTTAAVNATVHLLGSDGLPVAQAPLGANGSFNFADVHPGVYEMAVVGEAPLKSVPSGSTMIQIEPGLRSNYIISPEARDAFCYVQPQALSASLSNNKQAEALLRAYMAFNKDKYPKEKYAENGLYNQPFFGTYISGAGGDPLEVTFRSEVLYGWAEHKPIPDLLKFEFVRPDGSVAKTLTDSAAPYEAKYNVSQLPPGTSKLRVTAQFKDLQGNTRTCGRSKNIIVAADPMKHAMIQPTTGKTVWNAAQKQYTFEGQIPNVADLLPADFSTGDLPLVGRLENKLDAGVQMKGTIDLNGRLTLSMANARALARFLNIDVLNESQAIVPPEGVKVTTDVDDLSNVKVAYGPKQLVAFNEHITPFSGVLASFWGIVTVNASFTIGVSGEVVLSGEIRPLAPSLKADLTGTVEPYLTVSVWVDILLGIASAGADATASAGLNLPLHIDTDHAPPVWLGDPCLRLKVVLSLWAEVDVWFWSERWTIGNHELLDEHIPEGCAASLRAQGPSSLRPHVMAAPAVASHASGRMLSVYIEDSTEQRGLPAVQLTGRFWNPDTNAWKAPFALTDGTYAVHDPVVTWYGSETNPHAIVAWTETIMSTPEKEAAGDDMNAFLRRKEIMYRVWDGQNWSETQRLTTDHLPDGRAAIAGDEHGATLAWVRDLDGNVATRSDMQVAVSEWDGRAFDTPALLTGNSSGMNVQVSITRAPFTACPTCPSGSRRLVGWTYDADGELTTNNDRRIALARRDGDAASWSMLAPNEQFAGGVDSPALVLQPGNNDMLHLAFLMRGKDGNGVTDTGIGNSAQLWTARYNVATNAWNASAVQDEQQQPVRAERPRLVANVKATTIAPTLIFRRFGIGKTTGALGQLAMSQLTSNGIAPAPIYLTNGVSQRWQADATINPSNGKAVIVSVTRAATNDASLQLAPATSMLPAMQSSLLAEATDPVESLLVDQRADPALEPALTLSQVHAAPGTSVTVSAKVRNLGRATSNSLTVTFYRGSVGSGTPVGTATVAPLAFNETGTASITLTAGSGDQAVYAEMSANTNDANMENNRATGNLGELPMPQILGATESNRYTDAIQITWQPSNITGVAGYRILRSTAPNGPYELVGETTGTSFEDMLLTGGTHYYYVIEAYDAAGVRSAHSGEVNAGISTPAPQPPVQKVFLPLIKR